MKVLVINCGSSSLKYQLFNMLEEKVIAKGIIERIGIDQSQIKHQIASGQKTTMSAKLNNHNEAMSTVFNLLTNKEYGVINNLNDIEVIGHRVVHGGTKFNNSVVVTQKVKKEINELFHLAPLHNPANLIGIEACEKVVPEVRQVAVFDTAFHQTIPDYAHTYALPYDDCLEYGIRKYGFHGTSHKYVSSKAAGKLGLELKDIKMITCHLGNGASITAINKGKSVDTSMGFTPLDGLIMGTRSGAVDPAIIPFIMEKKNLTPEGVSEYLNKQSGVLGVSGVSNDFRDLEDATNNENARARLALEMFAYRVKSFIGSYYAIMNGLDALVFTAGLGENSPEMRESICSNLENLGIELDANKNTTRGREAIISSEVSKVKILVIPTDEELMIAREAISLVG